MMLLVSCGGEHAKPATAVPVGAGLPTEGVLEISSIAQFNAEIARDVPGVVVVADFHAEWCGPCRLLSPDLVALATAHPGKLVVLKVDIDQHPQLAARFQAESIPLLVTFRAGKESARQVGYPGSKERLAAWLALP